jgi:hypothetical protein
MADKKPEPTQRSRPKEGKPIEIPVPKRGEVDSLLERAMKPRDPASWKAAGQSGGERKGLAPGPVKG